MVEDHVTDGKRIAQLLASELSGLETGTLAAVSVTDADPDAEPSADGTPAYDVAFEGERVGTVRMFPGRVVVDLQDPPGEGGRTQDERLRVESGAAVKRAVDAVREHLRDVADG